MCVCVCVCSRFASVLSLSSSLNPSLNECTYTRVSAYAESGTIDGIGVHRRSLLQYAWCAESRWRAQTDYSECERTVRVPAAPLHTTRPPHLPRVGRRDAPVADSLSVCVCARMCMCMPYIVLTRACSLANSFIHPCRSAEVLYYRPDFAHFQHRSFVTRS